MHSHLHATYAFSAAEGLLDTCLFFAYAHLYSTVQLIKRGEMYPSHLPKSELKQCFLRRCSATTRISRGGEVVVRKGAAPVVSCSREKRQGHTITRILGVESYMVSAVCAIWCSWVARYLLCECLKYTLAVAGTLMLCERAQVSAETVASGCQKRFASSCSVNELPGKNQGHEVVIQVRLIYVHCRP